MKQTRVRNTTILIGGWDLLLCFTLFPVLNIWGIIYPFLCILKEFKIYYGNYFSNLVIWILTIVSLLRIPIFILSLIPVLLSPLLLLGEIAGHPHIDDFYCTVDWVCNDRLENDYLWKIVSASFVIVIDFIWVRPMIHKFYNYVQSSTKSNNCS